MTTTLLSPESLSEYLGVPLQTVYGWNSKGTGPKRCVIGRHVRYRIEDVEAWLRTRESSAAPAAR